MLRRSCAPPASFLSPASRRAASLAPLLKAVLARAHTELEREVEDRTADLRAANAQLRHQIEVRLQREAELIEAEKRYRTVADFTYDWEYWQGPDGRIIYMTPSVQRITGYPAQAFMDDPALLQQILQTKSTCAIMSGEGMVALWGALKSCLKPGDKVLAVATGLFGFGVGDMARALGAEVKTVGSLTPVAIRIDRTMVIPWSIMILVMGIILALMQQWPIFGFLQGASQNWLLVSNILLIIMLALIPAVFIPHNKKVESLLRTALAEGSVTPELSAALNDKRNQVAHHAEEIIILVIAALMVLKPF